MTILFPSHFEGRGQDSRGYWTFVKSCKPLCKVKKVHRIHSFQLLKGDRGTIRKSGMSPQRIFSRPTTVTMIQRALVASLTMLKLFIQNLFLRVKCITCTIVLLWSYYPSVRMASFFNTSPAEMSREHTDVYFFKLFWNICYYAADFRRLWMSSNSRWNCTNRWKTFKWCTR